MSGAFQTLICLYNALLFYVVTMLMLILQSWKKNLFRFKRSSVMLSTTKKRVSAYQVAFFDLKLKIMNLSIG